MAIATQDNRAGHPAMVLLDFWNEIGGFFAAVAKAGHAASRYQQLSALSANQVGSLGYGPDGATNVAFEESFGKL